MRVAARTPDLRDVRMARSVPWNRAAGDVLTTPDAPGRVCATKGVRGKEAAEVDSTGGRLT